MNAMQSMHDQPPERRVLTVRVAEDSGHVQVEVDDLGPGVPDHDRVRLFDAFFSTKADGLGLGLSICGSIIDQHGGQIDYEHLATGTRFVFRLPAAGRRQSHDPPPLAQHGAVTGADEPANAALRN
jgi:signal transduction histidine kinase